MEVIGGDYRVGVDAETQTASFSGTLRLNGADEYAPIQELLDELLSNNQDGGCTWDLRELVDCHDVLSRPTAMFCS